MSRTRRGFCVRLLKRIIFSHPSLVALGAVAINATAFSILPVYAEESPVSYPVAKSDWHTTPLSAWVGSETPSIKFDGRDDEFPNGILTVNHAVAILNGAHLRSGTINFDIKPFAYNFNGVVLRRQSNENGEIFYLRGDPDYPASGNCYQYSPIMLSMLQWNVYPNCQGPAPIALAGRNHVRLVVADEKMIVYLNHATQTALVMPKLQELPTEGRIALKGLAVFASFVINPAVPSPDNVQAVQLDPRTITAWQAARLVAWPAGQPTPTPGIPQTNAWCPVSVEPWGLIDLARSFAETHGDAPEIGWLRAIIDTAAPARLMLRLG